MMMDRFPFRPLLFCSVLLFGWVATSGSEEVSVQFVELGVKGERVYVGWMTGSLAVSGAESSDGQLTMDGSLALRGPVSFEGGLAEPLLNGYVDAAATGTCVLAGVQGRRVLEGVHVDVLEGDDRRGRQIEKTLRVAAQLYSAAEMERGMPSDEGQGGQNAALLGRGYLMRHAVRRYEIRNALGLFKAIGSEWSPVSGGLDAMSLVKVDLNETLAHQIGSGSTPQEVEDFTDGFSAGLETKGEAVIESAGRVLENLVLVGGMAKAEGQEMKRVGRVAVEFQRALKELGFTHGTFSLLRLGFP